jgi:hypothetical protein
MTISYSISIDYNDDGDFSDLGDAISADVLEATWHLGMSAPYQRLSEPASAEILLRNQTRDFSPEVESNLIGKFLRIQSHDGTTTRTHFFGAITALEPEAGQYGRQRARLFALGREAELAQQSIRLPLLLDFTADEALEAILQQVKWRYPVLDSMCIIGRDSIGSSSIFPDAAFSQSLDAAQSVFPYLGDDWSEGLPANQAIEQLVTAEGGRFFFNRAGEAIFYQRYHLLQNNAVVATFDDAMEGLDYRYGGEILNQLDVEIRPRSIGTANTLLWELANPIRLKRESIICLTARYTRDGFPVGAITIKPPQRGIDFLAFREEDGSGDSMTQHIQLVLLEAGASAATLEIRNPTRRDAYLTRLEIYGTPLIAGDPVSVTVQDKLSRAYYGGGALALKVPILADIEEAEGIARWELSRRKAPQGIVREIQTSTSHHPLETLSLSLFDRIRIIETQTGHDANYQILAEQHQLSKGGTVHEVSWLLEPDEAGQFFIVGTHSIGDESVVIVPR